MLYLFFDKGIDWANDTIKVALLNATYSESLGDEWFSDVSAKEVSGTGYSSGGSTLTGKTAARDETNGKITFSASFLTFSTVSLTNVGYAVIYKSTGVAGTSPLIKVVDLRSGGVGRNVTSDDINLQWAETGIYVQRPV